MAPSKTKAASCSALVTLALALVTAPGADACWRCRRPAPMSAYAPAPAYATTPQASPQGHLPLGAVSASAGSFLAWVNGHRSRVGLRPLAWDATAAADAAANSSMGLGHFTRGYRRGQVVGMGSLGSVQVAWLASPSHYAILMDPGATSVGFAGNGTYWAANVN